MVRHVAGGAQAKRVLIPDVLILGIDPRRVIAAAEKSELSVKSRICALESIDLDDSAHLPAEFCGNAGGVNVERFHVIGFDLGAKAGRTIVGERNAVDDKLGLI